MLTILNRSHENIIGIEAVGTISESDIEEIVLYLDERIEKYDKISCLIIITTSGYATLRAMYEDLMWLIKNLKHLDRMAIVGDKKWEELLIKADGLIFGERYFDISEMSEAWNYVEGKTP